MELSLLEDGLPTLSTLFKREQIHPTYTSGLSYKTARGNMVEDVTVMQRGCDGGDASAD